VRAQFFAPVVGALDHPTIAQPLCCCPVLPIATPHTKTAYSLHSRYLLR
jgi:hypothetical protein